MKLIACTLGAVTPLVMGRPYAFTQDEYGRFTCAVDDDRHASLLLSVAHYHEVPEHPADDATDDEPVRQKAPRAATGKTPRAAAGAKRTAEKKAEPEGAGAGGTESPDNDDATDEGIGQINGIDDAVKVQLEAIGFVTVDQIADLSEEDVARLDKDLDLKGAIVTADWIGQAKALIAARSAPQQPA